MKDQNYEAQNKVEFPKRQKGKVFGFKKTERKFGLEFDRFSRDFITIFKHTRRNKL